MQLLNFGRNCSAPPGKAAPLQDLTSSGTHIPARPQDAPVRQHKEEPAAEEAQLSPWWQWVLPPHFSDSPPDGKQHVLSQTRVTAYKNKCQHQNWQRGRDIAWGNTPDWVQLVGCRKENKMLQVEEGIWNHPFFLTDEHQPVLHPAKHDALLSLWLLLKCLSLHFPFQPRFFPESISLARVTDSAAPASPQQWTSWSNAWGCEYTASQLFLLFSPNFWQMTPQRRGCTSIHPVLHEFLWLFWLTLKGTADVERDLNCSHQERAVLSSLSQPRDTSAKEG